MSATKEKALSQDRRLTIREKVLNSLSPPCPCGKIATVLALLVLFSAGTAHAGAVRVAILPFEIHSEKDLSFLENDIFHLLANRLQWPGRVEVLDPKRTAALATAALPLDDAAMRNQGRKLGARFVLAGSLTLFGQSISLDLRLIDTAGNEPPMVFQHIDSGTARLIAPLNAFANQINRTVFGRQ